MIKNILTAVLLSISAVVSHSQIVFESGYFINESGQKINCLIKNVDWKNNPTDFEYKTLHGDSVKTIGIQAVSEFGVDNISRYVRSVVKIDRSKNEVHNLSTDKNPIFNEERLFLKVLIEGRASLFYYESGNLKRFFYRINDAGIEPLVYKRYVNEQKVLGKKNFFRQQLFSDLKCQDISSTDVQTVDYKLNDLVKFFSTYNECVKAEYVNYESKQKSEWFNLSLRPGISYSSLEVQQNFTSEVRNFEFESKFSARFGIEAEFILPYNKNKWSIIIEPTYQNFRSEGTTEVATVSGGVVISKVNYQSIELPLGIRHYFFLNDKSKIFANLSYIFDFSNSSVELTRSNGSVLSSLNIKSLNNIGIGVGYRHAKRYGVELRYLTTRDILRDHLGYKSDYRVISLIFGYSVF